jgi:hypothetical protein
MEMQEKQICIEGKASEESSLLIFISKLSRAGAIWRIMTLFEFAVCAYS